MSLLSASSLKSNHESLCKLLVTVKTSTGEVDVASSLHGAAADADCINFVISEGNWREVFPFFCCVQRK